MYQALGNVKDIEIAAKKHNVTQASSRLLHVQKIAAEESIISGLYITWVPDPTKCILTDENVADEIRNQTGQCARISSVSVCCCGHELKYHESVKVKRGYIRPPKCGKCRCSAYQYIPCRPEECGQWWLPRRKDFDSLQWQKRIQQMPHDYACIGCEQKVSDHETVFESKLDRIQRNATVDEYYIPLHESSEIYQKVFGELPSITMTANSNHNPTVSQNNQQVMIHRNDSNQNKKVIINKK